MDNSKFDRDLARISKGDGNYDGMVDLLDSSKTDGERFTRARAAIGDWLRNRIRQLTLRVEQSGSQRERNSLSVVSGIWQISLEQLEAGRDAFLPEPSAPLLGITVPARIEDANVHYIYAGHVSTDNDLYR